MQYFAKVLFSTQAIAFIVDFPRGANVSAGVTMLANQGWVTNTTQVLGTALGDMWVWT